MLNNIIKYFLPKESVPIDAINMSLFTRDSHSVWMGFSSDLKNFLQHIQHFKTLEEIRKAFIPISNTLIGITNAFKPNMKTIYVLRSPMADNNKGADWLSYSKEVKNPYYGQEMLTCGEVTKEIKQ